MKAKKKTMVTKAGKNDADVKQCFLSYILFWCSVYSHFTHRIMARDIPQLVCLKHTGVKFVPDVYLFKVLRTKS
jgi:hypothetical protein